MSGLNGSRVVVTRSVAQSGDLLNAIAAAGGVPIELPLVQIEDLDDAMQSLASAVASLTSNDWLIVLSPNGARRVVRLRDPGSCKLAVLAGGTAAVFEDAGWPVDLLPAEASSEGLLAAFEEVSVEGWVLIVQAERGRGVLAAGLRQLGVTVESVAAYRNVLPPLDDSAIRAAREADVVVFASPSAVRRYVDHVGATPNRAVCIGGVTAGAAVANGFLASMATAPTVDAIVDRLLDQ